MEFRYEHNGEVYRIEILKGREGFLIKLEDRYYSLMNVMEQSDGLFKFQLNRIPVKCRVATSGELRHIFIDGNVYQLNLVNEKDTKAAERVKRRTAGADDAAGSGQIQSPINGKIIKVRVEENTQVKPDQDLVIIEAMKMEHRIKAPISGIVKKLHVKEGDLVELGMLLVEIQKTDETIQSGDEK